MKWEMSCVLRVIYILYFSKINSIKLFLFYFFKNDKKIIWLFEDYGF